MNKDIMLTVRITPQQYVHLLENLVREKKTKSEFIRESLLNSLGKIEPKNCRKDENSQWMDGIWSK